MSEHIGVEKESYLRWLKKGAEINNLKNELGKYPEKELLPFFLEVIKEVDEKYDVPDVSERYISIAEPENDKIRDYKNRIIILLKNKKDDISEKLISVLLEKDAEIKKVILVKSMNELKLNYEKLGDFDCNEITKDNLKSKAKEMIDKGLEKICEYLIENNVVNNIENIYEVINSENTKNYLSALYKLIKNTNKKIEAEANSAFERINDNFKELEENINNKLLSGSTYGGKKQEKLRSNKNKTRRNINKYKKKRLSSKKR